MKATKVQRLLRDWLLRYQTLDHRQLLVVAGLCVLLGIMGNVVANPGAGNPSWMNSVGIVLGFYFFFVAQRRYRQGAERRRFFRRNHKGKK